MQHLRNLSVFSVTVILELQLRMGSCTDLMYVVYGNYLSNVYSLSADQTTCLSTCNLIYREAVISVKFEL